MMDHPTNVEQLEAQLDTELAELAQLLPPDHYARVEQFAVRIVQTVYAGLDATEAPVPPFGEPSVPCRGCGALLSPEVAAAALALRGDRPSTFPNGRPRPDLTGLAVWIAGALEHP